MTAHTHPAQIERLLELVSERVGLVRQLSRVMRAADEPQPPVLYAATLSNFDFKRAPPIERGAAGKGITESEAIGGAIGEAVERYCASHVDRQRLYRTPLGEAPAGAILPQDCTLYSEAQYRRPGFPHMRPTPELAIDWVRATELPDGRETWVPAVAVYMHGNTVMPGDALFTPSSSGLAAGTSVVEAVRSGLCELIERDAFLVMWMNRLAVPELAVDAHDDVLAGIVGHYACFGVELRLFDLTTDVGIPVVMALALAGDTAGPAAVVGLGCHLDPQVAALRAAFEVCQVRPSQMRRQNARTLAASEVRGIEDHSAFFAQRASLPELDFLLQGGRRRRLADLGSLAKADAGTDLATCVAALRKIGCRVAYAELTTADLAGYPIHVVRTLATGLQPIHFGDGLARLGSARLYEAAARMDPGHPPGNEDSLNPCPHPLA
jgi:ribosomal protein S12 methylthiotransferase accessory factor